MESVGVGNNDKTHWLTSIFRTRNAVWRWTFQRISVRSSSPPFLCNGSTRRPTERSRGAREIRTGSKAVNCGKYDAFALIATTVRRRDRPELIPNCVPRSRTSLIVKFKDARETRAVAVLE